MVTRPPGHVTTAITNKFDTAVRAAAAAARVHWL